MPSQQKTEFDKYEYYIKSVQNPEEEVIFYQDTYRELRKKEPITLREDFCGTFSISCEWVKVSDKRHAYGVDLDPEPISYGREHYLSKLTPEQAERVQILEKNVLDKDLPKSDVVAAVNFSYFIFKKRKVMLEYFKNCYEHLNKDGLLILDCFGGSETTEPNEEETEHEGFSYFWDQDSFDPINNHGLFHIHFQVEGEPKHEKAFTYDWRMWSIPELREIMEEAGFSKTYCYWEGTDEDGEGDGDFVQTEVGEDCESWIAYLVGEK